MPIFTDTESRDWKVVVTVDTLEECRDQLSIDLMQALGGDVLQRLGSDPALLASVLYVTCEEQVKERGLSPKQFAKAIFGDVLEKAADAFYEALTDFFPPRQRPVLAKVMAKVQEVNGMATSEALTALDNPAITEAAKRAIKKGEEEMLRHLSELGSSSGSAPASSA